MRPRRYHKPLRHPLGNDVALLFERLGDLELERGRLRHLFIYHDPWCQKHRGTGVCCCDPELELAAGTA